MKYILDTHVLIWMVEAPENLSAKVKTILQTATADEIAISAITPWEIAKKTAIGKLRLGCPVASWLKKATNSSGITLLPLGIDVSIESNQLPGIFHKDPADQIIVATARMHQLTLITVDKKLLEYPHVHTLW